MNPDQTLIPIAIFRLRRLPADNDLGREGDLATWSGHFARLEQLHRTPIGHDVWLPVQLEGFDEAN